MVSQLITQVIIDQLRASIGTANKSTTTKASRTIDGALGLPVAAVTHENRVADACATRKLFRGFAVRPCRTAGVPWKVRFAPAPDVPISGLNAAEARMDASACRGA